MQEWAQRKQATAAQIALAWLMAQKPWIADPRQDADGAHGRGRRAVAITFSNTELEELGAALADIEIRGEWLPPAVLAFGVVEAPGQQGRP